MKWFVGLFALYILILGCIPCRADDDCCMEETIVNAAHTAASKDGQTPIPPSPCSPFFACGANHAVVVPGMTLELPKTQTAVPARQAIYKASPLPDFPPSIWQPPRAA
jgi:hypothetical protein